MLSILVYDTEPEPATCNQHDGLCLHCLKRRETTIVGSNGKVVTDSKPRHVNYAYLKTFDTNPAEARGHIVGQATCISWWKSGIAVVASMYKAEVQYSNYHLAWNWSSQTKMSSTSFFCVFAYLVKYRLNIYFLVGYSLQIANFAQTDIDLSLRIVPLLKHTQ